MKLFPAFTALAFLVCSNHHAHSASVNVIFPKENQIVKTNQFLARFAVSPTGEETIALEASLDDSASLEPLTIPPSTNWFLAISELNPGYHYFRVNVASSLGGVTEVKRRFFVAGEGAFLADTSGSGTIVGVPTAYGTPQVDLNLEYGRKYTLIAQPDPGNILSNWSVSGGTFGVDETQHFEGNRFSFHMADGTSVTANFIPNPFLPAAGIYAGLFSEFENPTIESAGYVRMKLNSKRGLSGTLNIAGNVVPFSGLLNIDGTGSFVTRTRLARYGKPELLLDLAVNFEQKSINGIITEAGNDGDWNADLHAFHIPWTTNETEQATEYINHYTIRVPVEIQPYVGDTSGALKINKLGRLQLTGYTGDGQVMRQAGYVNREGEWPFFAPLYPQTNLINGKLVRETTGFIMGWVQFLPNLLGNTTPGSSAICWHRPPGDNMFLPDGFTQNLQLEGSRWIPPVPKSGERALDMTEATFDFYPAYNVDELFSAHYLVTTNTTLAVIKNPPTTYPFGTKAILNPRTGVLSGSHAWTNLVPSVTRKWYGVVLQDENVGGGFYTDPLGDNWAIFTFSGTSD